MKPSESTSPSGKTVHQNARALVVIKESVRPLAHERRNMATTPISEVLHYLRGALVPPTGAGQTDAQLLAAFIERHDEAAMTTLVQRHAAMVWGVCRRILRNQHDAEDAF